jgi:hypothetical protein
MDVPTKRQRFDTWDAQDNESKYFQYRYALDRADAAEGKTYRVMADWFFESTGVLAPGKDYPPGVEPPEDRMEQWCDFLTERGI